MEEKTPEQMTDEELDSELERLHKVLHDGQETRMKNQERPDEMSTKEHWETWDRMFELFTEKWNRKEKVNP